jgi:hypothetical protein
VHGFESRICRRTEFCDNATVTLPDLFNDGFSAIPPRIDVLLKIRKIEAVFGRRYLDEGDRPPSAQPAQRLRRDSEKARGFVGGPQRTLHLRDESRRSRLRIVHAYLERPPLFKIGCDSKFLRKTFTAE